MSRKFPIPAPISLFVVERLACFESPKTVAEAVKREFGLELSRQAIERYDPGKVQGANLSAKFREHFQRTREKFRADTEAVPISSKAVRLWRLNDMATALQEQGNYLGAAALLEQAAKEMGGVYTGRGGAIESKPDGPSEPQSPGADHLAELGARFAKGLTVVQGGKDDEQGKSS